MTLEMSPKLSLLNSHWNMEPTSHNQEGTGCQKQVSHLGFMLAARLAGLLPARSLGAAPPARPEAADPAPPLTAAARRSNQQQDGGRR